MSTKKQGMKYSEIVEAIDNVFSFFQFHNKNLTKAQEHKLWELQDLIHEMQKQNQKR